MEYSTEIIVAIGGAALLATLAFRYLIDSVIKINNELQEALQDRHEVEEDRAGLLSRIATLEAQINGQASEVQDLQRHLQRCKEHLSTLQSQS